MPETNNVEQVTAGKPKIGGAVFEAPLETTLPTSAATELNSAFKGVGYISEDGVTHTASPETTKVKAWGGDTVLAEQTGKTDQYKMKFVQGLNEEVLKAVNGEENVTGTLEAGLTVKGNNKEVEARSWVIDQVLRGNVLFRTVIPNGKITEIGDTVYRDNEPIGYEVTIDALPDAAGNTHYEYYKNGPTGATGETA